METTLKTMTLEMYEELHDQNLGFCTSCADIADGCEPDARNYICESCEQPTVFGLDECLIMGLVI